MVRQWLRLQTSCIAACVMVVVSGCELRSGQELDNSARTPNAVATKGVPRPVGCDELTDLHLLSGRVVAAEAFLPGGLVTGGRTANIEAAAHFCRAQIRLTPAEGSVIHVEVWLPRQWNEKLYGLGGSGFDGGLAGSAEPLNTAIAQGYAAVATDAGHTPAPSPESWAYQQPEKVIDFGYRGNHLAAVAAKEVIKAHYGRPAKQAYFLGCSNGGRDALMLVSRYPDDYNGVVAGAPAIRYVEIITQFLWNYHAVHGGNPVPELEAKLGLVHSAIIQQCDTLDGVADGLLEDPRQCTFDPATLRCEGDDASRCLTSSEIAALRKLYGGPHLKDGQQIYPGPALGSEGAPGNWSNWITTAQTGFMGQELYRWLMLGDPDFRKEDFVIDKHYPQVRKRMASTINVEDPDIREFVDRGGKLIIYQGWDDPIIAPESTIAYYDSIQRALGKESASDAVRLYMAPGMMHCALGNGPWQFDMQPVLEDWVEEGVAPAQVIAIKPDSATPFTRPLCPWPMVATYVGSGAITLAENFRCQ